MVRRSCARQFRRVRPAGPCLRAPELHSRTGVWAPHGPELRERNEPSAPSFLSTVSTNLSPFVSSHAPLIAIIGFFPTQSAFWLRCPLRGVRTGRLASRASPLAASVVSVLISVITDILSTALEYLSLAFLGPGSARVASQLKPARLCERLPTDVHGLAPTPCDVNHTCKIFFLDFFWNLAP